MSTDHIPMGTDGSPAVLVPSESFKAWARAAGLLDPETTAQPMAVEVMRRP